MICHCVIMKTTTFDQLFNEVRAESEAQYRAEQTPGTPEYARAQAQTAAYKARVAGQVAAVIASGGVIGMTHTEQGEPIDLSPEDDEDENEVNVCEHCGAVLDDEDNCSVSCGVENLED